MSDLTPSEPSAEPLGWARADELHDFDSGWHAHPEHQVLYACSGALRVEIDGETWLLPSSRGAWIRAETPHRVTTQLASLRTVYLTPPQLQLTSPVCIITMTPLASELMRYAQRWPRELASHSIAHTFFTLLVRLFEDEWQHHQWRFCLPTPRSEPLQRMAAHVSAHLDCATITSAARAAHLSTRTLTRQCVTELGMTWREYLHRARMIQAIALLEHGTPVGEVANTIGFASHSAFTKSFRDFTGSLPSQHNAPSSPIT